MDQIKTGLFIAEQRKKLGLTQAQLAKIISVSDRTISKWERGVGLPDVTLMLPLCEALHISVNDLLCGEKILEGNIQEKTDDNVIKIIKAYKKRSNGIFRLMLTVFFLVTLFIAITFSDRYVSKQFSKAGLQLSSIFENEIRQIKENANDNEMAILQENIPLYKDWISEEFELLDLPVCILLVDGSGNIIAGTDTDSSSKDYRMCYEQATTESSRIPGFQQMFAAGDLLVYLSGFTYKNETYILSVYSSHNHFLTAIKSEFFLFALMISGICFVCIIILYALIDRFWLSAGLRSKETVH